LGQHVGFAPGRPDATRDVEQVKMRFVADKAGHELTVRSSDPSLPIHTFEVSGRPVELRHGLQAGQDVRLLVTRRDQDGNQHQDLQD
jgi:hypothetical protein